ncbi:hypothetical protein L484_027198 [Morus notabilis]|uniref:Uncharacterized protein n=1 Tax=Morus notabilis TaxID=981085 RepID=W9S971_9ROSA|nr:hypothetical protein L484_027198 [Morus notabilis]
MGEAKEGFDKACSEPNKALTTQKSSRWKPKSEKAEDQGGFFGLEDVRIFKAVGDLEDLVIEDERGNRFLGFYEEQVLSPNTLNMSHLASVVPAEWEDNTEGRLGGETTVGSVLDVGGIGGDLRLEGMI